MSETPDDAAPDAADDLLELMVSWHRDLTADESASPLTLKTYRESINAFVAYLRSLDEPPPVLESITRDHIRDWQLALKEAGKAVSTRGTRFRNLRSFMNWLVRERELGISPMDGLNEPKVKAQPVPVVRVDVLQAVLATCDTSTFEGRRDEALIRAYADGGMRLAECATLDLPDADMDQQVFWVLGKGGKRRAAPFGQRTTRAMDRYLRARKRHPKVKEFPNALWLGRQGPLTPDAVYKMILRRFERAGVERITPHQLRHTAAHQLKLAGMNDQSLRRIFGWSKTSRMPDWYGESAADERALEDHRRLSFGDQL